MSLAFIIISVLIISVSSVFVRPIKANVENPSFFWDYTEWNSGGPLHHSSLFDVVRTMQQSRSIFDEEYMTGVQLTDINGDGLQDVLYSQIDDKGQFDRAERYAVFVNNGDFSFSNIFKCYITVGPQQDGDSGVPYGDCAE